MVYTVENNEVTVLEAVLKTTEKTFSSSKLVDQPLVGQTSTPVNAEVYFQIED